MNNINLTSKSDCCGCSACKNICAHDAITMRKDKQGFEYPTINRDKCVNCGLCKKVCPFINPNNINIPQKVYAFRINNERALMESQSGGAFVAISDVILEKGGAVYGAVLDERFQVFHKRVLTKKERNELRKSKYIQSHLRDTFDCVKRDLKENRIVLFSGTPCQIAAIKNYIPEKLRENLFLVDLICHGVAGPEIWSEYVKYLERNQKSKLIEVNFRNKELYGWHSHKETFKYLDNHEVHTYKFLFYTDLLHRDSCSKCPFASTKRGGDITIGDMWSQTLNEHSIIKDNKGCSCIFINTEKGYNLYQELGNLHTSFEVTLEDAMQPNLISPTKKHPLRRTFTFLHSLFGFKFVKTIFHRKSKIYKALILTARITNYIKRILTRK